MGNKKLKNREEIPQNYKWKIEAMYADDTSWENDIQEVLDAVDAFGAYQGRLAADASTLAKALEDKDAIWQKLEKAFGIKFDLFEIIEIRDVKGLVDYISRKKKA